MAEKEWRFAAGAPVQLDSRFDPEPGDRVTITAYGLNYSGRVLEVRRKIGCTTYYVEFARDGLLDASEFYLDQIKARKGENDA